MSDILIPAEWATKDQMEAQASRPLSECIRTWRTVCGAWERPQAMKELGLILEALADERDAK